FMAGVNFAFKPVESQEFNLNITNAYNNKLAQEYGADLKVMKENGKTEAVEAAKHPLTYIFLWNGNFFGDKLQTRWSVGTQTQAKDQSSQMVMLGQKLNLPTFQWYFDYMGAFDDVDRLGIATSDLSAFRGKGNVRYGKVNYNSFITKVNWQFVPQWNLMLKGMYETASVSKIEELKNYRKSFGYFASLEYYPVKSQDCRVFLSYIGRNYKFTDKSKLADYNTSRIELGFMYRIKAF
ncbi:MAG: porin, partial [Hoylesella buccalis]